MMMRKRIANIYHTHSISCIYYAWLTLVDIVAFTGIDLCKPPSPTGWLSLLVPFTDESAEAREEKHVQELSVPVAGITNNMEIFPIHYTDMHVIVFSPFRGIPLCLYTLSSFPVMDVLVTTMTCAWGASFETHCVLNRRLPASWR